jgi:hypothetical protein
VVFSNLSNLSLRICDGLGHATPVRHLLLILVREVRRRPIGYFTRRTGRESVPRFASHNTYPTIAMMFQDDPALSACFVSFQTTLTASVQRVTRSNKLWERTHTFMTKATEHVCGSAANSDAEGHLDSAYITAHPIGSDKQRGTASRQHRIGRVYHAALSPKFNSVTMPDSRQQASHQHDRTMRTRDSAVLTDIPPYGTMCHLPSSSSSRPSWQPPTREQLPFPQSNKYVSRPIGSSSLVPWIDIWSDMAL